MLDCFIRVSYCKSLFLAICTTKYIYKIPSCMELQSLYAKHNYLNEIIICNGLFVISILPIVPH